MNSLRCVELKDEQGQHHIHCHRGQVGRYVLLPGDPFRTDYIASFLQDARLIAHNREHKTWTGTLAGEKVTVTSTGMGGPSASIAVEELIHCGADTFIRVGTAGRLCPAAQDPAVAGVIATGAVRSEGLTGEYVPYEFPAIGDRHVVAALADSAKELGYCFAEGIVHCKDSFYGQIGPQGLPNDEVLRSKWRIWERSGVLASEMETAAVFVVCTIRGCRAGSILSFGNMEQTVQTACAAIKKLVEKDKKI